MNDTPTTPVVFRVWKEGGEVLALFPTLSSDIADRYCSCYDRIGQHSSADYHSCIKLSRPAGGMEAARLEKELHQLGYRLRVVKRASRAMHRERRIAANFS